MTKTPTNPDPSFPCADPFCFSSCTNCKFPEAGEHHCPKCGRVHPVARACQPDRVLTAVLEQNAQAKASPPWDAPPSEAPASPATPHALLHHLWSKAVGTPGYNKEQWEALERHIWGPPAPSSTERALAERALWAEIDRRTERAMQAEDELRKWRAGDFLAPGQKELREQEKSWAETERALRKALAQAQADVIECQETYAAAKAAAQGYRAALAQSQDHPQEYFEFELLERLAKAVGL